MNRSGQLRQGGEGRVHVSGVRFDAERLIHRNTGQDHRGTKRGIALKERLAVLIIANKADFRFPFRSISWTSFVIPVVYPYKADRREGNRQTVYGGRL